MGSPQGYLAASIGSIAGALILGTGAGALASLVPCSSDAFGCLGVAILALGVALAAATLGAVLGCYLALRSRGHARAGRTAWALFGLLLVTSVLIGVVVNARLLNDSSAASLAALVVYGALPALARRLTSPSLQVSRDAVDI